MKNWFVLYIQVLGLLFFGFVINNVIGVAIHCTSNGFDLFAYHLSQIPYLLDFIFSLVLALVLTWIVWRKTKK